MNLQKKLFFLIYFNIILFVFGNIAIACDPVYPNCYDDGDCYGCESCSGGTCGDNSDNCGSNEVCFCGSCYCYTADDWHNIGNVSMSPSPYLVNKIVSGISSVPGLSGFSIVDDLSADYAQYQKDCCPSSGDMIEDGELKVEGGVSVGIDIDSVKIWPSVPTQFDNKKIDLIVIEITLDLDVALKLSVNSSVNVTIGKIVSSCTGDDCVTGEFNAGITGSLSFVCEAIVCIDTWWTSEECAGIDITATFGSLTFGGEVGYNKNSCSEGLTGDWGVTGNLGITLNVHLWLDDSEYNTTLGPYSIITIE